MARTGKDKIVWAELQKQLGVMGLQAKRGTIQDAHSSKQIPDLQRSCAAETLKPGAAVMAPELRKATNLISASNFIKTDIDYGLIREIETATASLHDSQVDPSVEGEIVIRDRGYFGVMAKGIYFAMKRRTTEKPLDDLDKERNWLISILRLPGEKPRAVIKRVFGAGRVLVTSVK